MDWVIQLHLKHGTNAAFLYLNVMLCNKESSFSVRVADMHKARTVYRLLMTVDWTSHSYIRICHVFVKFALNHTARAAQADPTSVWLDWGEVKPAGRPLYSLSAYSFSRKPVMTPTLWGPALLSWGIGLNPRLWRYVTATCCRFFSGCLVFPPDADATQWICSLLHQRLISSLSP